MLKLWRLCVLLWLLSFPRQALAHSMYQSSVLIDVHSSSLTVELQLPPSKLGQVLGRTLTQSDIPGLAPELERYIGTRLAILDEQGTPWSAQAKPQLRWQTVDGAPYLVFVTGFHPNAGTDPRCFIVSDRVITDTIASHAVLVSIRSDWNGNTFANEPNLVGIIRGDQMTLPVELERGSWLKGFRGVFHLGLRHIAEGTDHLLFLLTLLLPAPLSYLGKHWSIPVSLPESLGRIVRIATAFTLGHSVTLALASFGFVRVPEQPIEVLIATSILVSAVHAIRPLFPGRESFIAASFGLIHGLAFASTLAELGLRGWDCAASVLAFNLGIESMQLVVIACVLPSLLLLSRTGSYAAFRIIVAAFAGLASLGWVAERITGKSLAVDRAVDLLAAHAVFLAGALLCCSVWAFLLSGRRKQR